MCADLASAPLAVVPMRDPAPLGRAWDALIDDDEPGAVFRSPAWMLPWWERFAADREARVLTAWRRGALVGVLPCYRERATMGVRRLRLMGDGIVGSDHLGVIARRADREEVAAAFARALLDEEPLVRLDGLAEDDPLATHLMERAGGGAMVEASPQLPCPFLTIEGPFERWLDALPKGAGSQYRRRLRWLEKRPGFAIERIEGGARLDEGLEDLFRLHALRWAEEGGSDGIDSEEVRAFHRASAASLAARGELRLHRLHAEGGVRAALYGFRRGARYAFYQSGLDPAWRDRSVGTVLLVSVIREAFETGAREFDFLRGGEAYKSTFASGQRSIVAVRAARAGPGAVVSGVEDALRAARAVARERLPAAWVETIRRARRRWRAA